MAVWCWAGFGVWCVWCCLILVGLRSVCFEVGLVAGLGLFVVAVGVCITVRF